MSSVIGLVLGLLAAAFKSSSELVSKFHLNDDLNEYVASWALRGSAIPILALLVWLTDGGIPELDREFWYAVAIATPLSVIATVLYMKAIKHSDVSLVSPLKATTPMFLLITSPLILGEFPSPLGLAGVFFITAGVYILKIDARKPGELLAPFRAILNDKGARYMLGLVLIYSITSNIDKIGVEASSPVFYALSIHVVVTIFLTVIVMVKTDGGMRKVAAEWKAVIPIGTLAGLAVAAQMFALTYTLVIYVIALKRCSILGSVVGGRFLFGEESFRERVVGAVIIVIGVILISLAL